tara:strand:+ start:2009 stop:3022 length:1014 start_codon:yes stop_codon:yes gene_type:complete
MEYQEHTFLNSLLSDPSFENWVRKTNKNDLLFWNEWILSHPDQIETIDTARSIILGITFKSKGISSEEVDMALTAVLKKVNNTRSFTRPVVRSARVISLLKYGAAAAAALVLFVLIANMKVNTEVIHKTGYGETIDLTLFDGTSVTLNGNSEIRYDKKNSRSITLHGEAYFKVKSIPATHAKFWVNTEDLQVEVYGTQFQVNTRDMKTNVVLDEGSIHLLLKNGISKNMVPGDFVSFSKEKDQITHKKVTHELEYILWRKGTYIFNNTNLKEVMKYVEHTYGVSYEFADKELEAKKITGGIPNHNLNICLSAIEKSTGTKIVLKDKRLLITTNENLN